jgi:predicted amidohydrolase
LRKYKIAVIQIDTKSDMQANLKKISEMIDRAVMNGANFISLPENMSQMTNLSEERIIEDIPGTAITFMSEIAIKYNIWIHCGSIKEYNKNGKTFNTTVVLNNKGKIIGKYRKIHLFDVDLKESGSFRESDKNANGEDIVNVETEMGNLGLSICYDIRFPELYRLMTLNGAEVIFVPANFTSTTGKAHWETLLRARAIENGVYIVASAQTGQKHNMLAYGHSMIVDPWGEVIAQAQDEETIIYGEIDLDYIYQIREKVPSIKNRREEVYDLSLVTKLDK